MLEVGKGEKDVCGEVSGEEHAAEENIVEEHAEEEAIRGEEEIDALGMLTGYEDDEEEEMGDQERELHDMILEEWDDDVGDQP